MSTAPLTLDATPRSSAWLQAGTSVTRPFFPPPVRRAIFVASCAAGCLLSLAAGFVASVAFVVVALLTFAGSAGSIVPLLVCGIALYAAGRACGCCYDAARVARAG